MKTIDIKLKNINEFTNKYNDKLLNNELDSYIIENAKHLDNNEINIKIQGIMPKDQNKVQEIIYTNYQKKVINLTKIDKYDNYFHLILLLLGIILIVISEQLLSFFSEIFLIAGWVVIWEMVYDILFTSIKRKKDLNLYKKIANSKIIFEENQND